MLFPLSLSLSFFFPKQDFFKSAVSFFFFFKTFILFMGYSSLWCLGFLLRWLLLLLSMGSSMCGLQSLMCVLRSCTLQALDMSLVVVAHGPSCSEKHRISPDQELNSCPLYWPWRREWQSTPVFLLGESHGQTMGSQRVRHDWATNTLTFFHSAGRVTLDKSFNLSES